MPMKQIFFSPNTFEQMELSKEMLGKAAVYLKGVLIASYAAVTIFIFFKLACHE